MQRLEVSGAVRPLYGSLGVKGASGRWKVLRLLLEIPKAHSTYLRAQHKRELYALFPTLRLDPPKG